jgi:hypothetical protein
MAKSSATKIPDPASEINKAAVEDRLTTKIAGFVVNNRFVEVKAASIPTRQLREKGK